MLPTWDQVEFWLFTLVCAGVGAYAGSYLKKKGENLATHEDLDKLIKQVEATTEATKAIETKISNEVWDRQKQWELTRDGALKLMEAHAQLEDANTEINRVCERLPDWATMHTAVEHWRLAQRGMIDAINILNFVCWKNETSYALVEYLVELDFIRGTLNHESAREIAAKTFTLKEKFIGLKIAIRKELRLQAKESGFLIPTPQSSGSSAVQGPDH